MSLLRQRFLCAHGFTLLELIVANVIAVIVLGSVAVALRTVNSSQHRSRAGVASLNPAREGIVALLRNDLTNSRRIWYYPDGTGVALSGYAGISPVTYQPTGELCRVYYRVVNGVLMRMQQSLEESAARPTWSEIVCSGVTAFTLVPVPDREALPSLPSREGSPDLRSGLQLPGRVTLTIQSREPGLLVSEDLWLR